MATIDEVKSQLRQLSVTTLELDSLRVQCEDIIASYESNQITKDEFVELFESIKTEIEIKALTSAAIEKEQLVNLIKSAISVVMLFG